MRKPLVAGNWKMHGNLAQAKTLIEKIKTGKRPHDVDLLLLPPFVHLSLAHHLLAHTHILLGAQNLFSAIQGAYTGEVSGQMLVDLGCQFVLVGHSERRVLFQEDLKMVAEKFRAAVDAGLLPILCVGETLSQYKAHQTEQVIWEQLESVIQFTGIEAFKNALIAYEPVWAIGTGLTAKPEEAQAVHAMIRQLIGQNDIAIGKAIRILYGGSVKPDNAKNLFGMPDIDGGLVGGASLDAESFLAIVQAAASEDERASQV